MLTNIRHQNCPRCAGTLNVEHVAAEEVPSHTVTYLLCEFCGFGVETLWKRRGSELEEVFSFEHRERLDPALFSQFVSRLRAARSA
jgi:hypothetical protein